MEPIPLDHPRPLSTSTHSSIILSAKDQIKPRSTLQNNLANANHQIQRSTNMGMLTWQSARNLERENMLKAQQAVDAKVADLSNLARLLGRINRLLGPEYAARDERLQTAIRVASWGFVSEEDSVEAEEVVRKLEEEVAFGRRRITALEADFGPLCRRVELAQAELAVLRRVLREAIAVEGGVEPEAWSEVEQQPVVASLRGD